MKWMHKWITLATACLCAGVFYVAPVHAAPEGLDNAALERLINERTGPQASSGDEAGDLIMNAMGLLGVAYRFGGNSPVSGLDCSGFMQYIFRKSMNINLPRTSSEMAQIGTQISRSALQVGDMVFFNTAGRRISHVGMYIGDNRFIHAPRKGKSIEITSLENKYWNSKYVTARRVKKHDSARFTD